MPISFPADSRAYVAGAEPSDDSRVHCSVSHASDSKTTSFEGSFTSLGGSFSLCWRGFGSSESACANSEPADIASDEESAGAILLTLRFGLVFVLAVSPLSFLGLASTRRVPSLGQILVAGEKCCPHSLQVLSIVMLPDSSTKFQTRPWVNGAKDAIDAVLSATKGNVAWLHGYFARKSRRINHQLLLHVSHSIII